MRDSQVLNGVGAIRRNGHHVVNRQAPRLGRPGGLPDRATTEIADRPPTGYDPRTQSLVCAASPAVSNLVILAFRRTETLEGHPRRIAVATAFAHPDRMRGSHVLGPSACIDCLAVACAPRLSRSRCACLAP